MSPLPPSLQRRLLAGVTAAGREVLAIRRRSFAVELKDDGSPVTEADLAAQGVLLALLAALTPRLPVLSEETAPVPWAMRRRWRRYWLLDPLDGTREFVAGRDDFTLNLALVEDGVPVFGLVHAPAFAASWYGGVGLGARRRCHRDGDERAIRVRPLPDPARTPWRVLGSRAHGLGLLDAFCQALPPHRRVARGSSLKLCLIAEGAADLYPRFGPTGEWDTAAGQAVLVAAGGGVLEADGLATLRCNRRREPLNPDFIACSARDPRWERALAATRGAPR
ncbi:3'(2'),5'-bisphosphate nucleotidase CysQ [Halomonas koreensis]|uniref:3'(2'),5'-bisphosphate nucleotidase CysQ n=1 Tax=Halomonas koreensis TaxID=245385 RepID=A0ABU1FYJ2_9GAMM|nr:3'(2'),5'-bisphosphate nucleotidase CysQ [Halomonas koreensis]MDR5865742.1 3'(2'),5'-bisphosphate nucleotidase CysQ [Halomonas koreensis]